MPDRVSQRCGQDIRRVQRDHAAEALSCDQFDSCGTESERKKPVVGGRLSSPLEVPEHEASSLDSGHLPELLCHQLSNSTVTRRPSGRGTRYE